MNLRTTTHLGLYILDGHTPVACHDVFEWSETRYKQDSHVADEMVGNTRISTVFLGLDHSWQGGPPMLFETMTFDENGSTSDPLRCSTWEEAEQQHQRVVDQVRSSQDEPGTV